MFIVSLLSGCVGYASHHYSPVYLKPAPQYRGNGYYKNHDKYREHGRGRERGYEREHERREHWRDRD